MIDYPPDAHDLMVAALAAADADDQERAARLFERALALEPDNPGVLTGYAIWHRKAGRLREAVLACDAAIRLAPDYPDAWLERGTVLSAGGSRKAARESFTTAVRLAPDNPVALAGLASQAALIGDAGEAEEAARRALAIDPANLLAAGTLAGLWIERSEAQAAPGLLAEMIDRAAVGNDRSIAANWLGRAYEQLGDHEGAYRYFALAKADFAQINAPLAARMSSQTDFIEAITSALSSASADEFTPMEQDSSAGAISPHIFLIGYPRSGTTLVENILASLPGVAASEEWPTFADADQRYLMGDAKAVAAGLRDFAALKATGRKEARDAYWRRVREAGARPQSAAFVDMDPLKATRLPFIARLFPDARVLIMRRDPRDVVWSCFKTMFAMNSNTLEYTTLERAARHYDAMMRLTDLALTKLPVAAREVRYRELIRDFDRTTQEVCAFAGLQWTPDVRRFDRTATTRGVGTASAGQVRKGLYDGAGQWRPYERWLEPVMPILEPWIERFGDPD